MGPSNPIYYKDLITPDGSIRQAIEELKDLNDTYKTLIELIKSNAGSLAADIGKIRPVTKETQEETEKMTYAARALKRAEEELELALSETGATIQSLKNQTAEANAESRQQDILSRKEATSYKALAAELKLVINQYKEMTAEEAANSAKGRELLNTILTLKAQLKQYDDRMKLHIEQQKAIKQHITEEEKARLKLQAALDGTTERLAKLNREADIEAKKAKLRAVINSEAEGSYNRLSAQYSLNKIKLNAMSQAERETTATGQALVKETYEIYQAMIKAQEATGKYTLSVGNYKKSWDGFGVAMNQVLREVPSAAISLNTFFLAISNNVPILVDELQKLIEKNKILKAEGKAQISIWGQLFKSVFSFNTLLIAVLTLLAMHGEAVVKWVAEMWTGHKALMSVNDAIKNVNKSLAEGTGDYGRALVSYKKLQDEWKDLKGLKDREEWLLKNKDAFDQLGVSVTTVNDADNIFIDNTEAFLLALKERAKATAAEELAVKKYQEAFAKREEAKLERTKGPGWTDKLTGAAIGAAVAGPLTIGAGLNVSEAYTGLTDVSFLKRIKDMEDEADVAEKAADSYYELADSYREYYNELLKGAGIRTRVAKTQKGRRLKDPADYVDRTDTQVQKEYAKSITKLEREEFENRRKAAIDTYNAETAALYDKYNKNKRLLEDEGTEYKKLTEDQKDQILHTQDTIIKTIENKRKGLLQDLDTLDKEHQISELQLLQETINLRLETVREGSEEELRLRMQSYENQRKIMILQNQLKPEAERVSESDINASFDYKRTSSTTSFNLSEFDQQQALEEARFNTVKHTEDQITAFKLRQERERWKYQIELAKAGSLDWSKEQIEAAEATVTSIENELQELTDFIASVGRHGLGYSLLEQLGFDDDQISALQTAADQVVSSLQDIMDSEVELAQVAVEAAEERANAAKSLYETELEARANGYANRAATAKKEYELEKKKQRQKEQLLAQAQRRQQQIDSLTQSSSLITASANIWSSLSGIPFVGPALALAAIATMWSSFAAAKVKANQVTKAQSEEYGDGGLEFLEGGSHASGNDIDLGVSNKRHKRMRAEGGEALAIINKKQTRKYQKELPGIIDSLNKGTFEDTYSKVFDSGNTAVSIVNKSDNIVDLTNIEDEVEKIRKQNEVKYQLGPDGTVLKIKGNVKQIIR